LARVIHAPATVTAPPMPTSVLVFCCWVVFVFISTVCYVLVLNLVTYFVRMADLLPDQVFRLDVNAVGIILVD
jgi:hypothetical protein